MTAEAPARRRFRLDLRLTFCAVPALAVLVGLGAWQLQRLDWKEGVIAERAARLAAPPLAIEDIGDADWRGLEHRRVRLSGRYLHDREMLVVNRLRRGQAGYGLVTPLVLGDGAAVLVDRGWVPLSWPEGPRAGRPPAGEDGAAGLLRAGGRLNSWQPDNDPAAGQWFFVDVPRMSAHAGLGRARPYYVRLLPEPGRTGFPVPRGAGEPIPNRHLEYALTWFALAAALVAVFALYHVRRR